MQRQLKFVCLMMGLAMASQALGQQAGSIERQLDRQFQLFGGILSGETLIETKVGGERVTGRADTGFMAGFRIGEEEEFNGWEFTLAVVVSDLEIIADPFATSLPAESDSSLVMAMFNLMHFPAGNDMADGRIRPFLTLGTGLAYLNNDDFDKLDNEWLYNMNTGFGIKFLMDETGDSVLRLDWRWHYLRDFSSELERIYRQEISIGFGKRF